MSLSTRVEFGGARHSIAGWVVYSVHMYMYSARTGQNSIWDAYIITTIPERTLDGLNILDFLDFTRITSTIQVLVTLYTYGMQQTFWSADHHDLSVAVVAMLAVPGQRERLVVQC